MLCDKCNLPVDSKHDATFLDSFVYHEPLLILINQPRHITCSPSRAQYIVHPDFLPVFDNRPEYDKRLLPDSIRIERENKYTAAWIELQHFELYVE